MVPICAEFCQTTLSATVHRPPRNEGPLATTLSTVHRPPCNEWPFTTTLSTVHGLPHNELPFTTGVPLRVSSASVLITNYMFMDAPGTVNSTPIICSFT